MGDTGVFCGIGSCVGDGEAPSCLNHESDVHVAPPDDDDLEGDILFQEGDLAGAALAYTEAIDDEPHDSVMSDSTRATYLIEGSG